VIKNTEHLDQTTPNKSFVIHPVVKKTRPAGRDTTKQSNAAAYVINKVTKNAKEPMEQSRMGTPAFWGTPKRSLTDANTHMQSIAKMQTVMANHQVMIQAPDEVRQKYFDEVYELNLLEAKKRHLEEEVKHAKLRRRMKEAQKTEKEPDVVMVAENRDKFSNKNEGDMQYQECDSH